MTTPSADGREDPVRLDSVIRDMAAVEHLLNEYIAAVRVLPRVDESGGSECPFAAELYAKKEELQQQLQSKVEWLRSQLGLVYREIDRCNDNSSAISAGHGRLHGDAATGRFEQAGEEVDSQRQRYVKLALQVMEVIERAEAAIREGMRKQYPGQLPQQVPGLPPPAAPQPLGPSVGPGPATPGPIAAPPPLHSQELDDLFDLGLPGKPGA